MTKDDALRMMLGPFKAWRDVPGNEDVVEELTKIINAVEKVLAQPEQEPCGWQFYHDGKWHNGMETNDHRANTEAAGIPIRDLYTHPPQRKPLTDEQKLMCWSRATHDADVEHKTEHQCLMDYGSEIEAKHGIKENT
jgi:hypothetical protein